MFVIVDGGTSSTEVFKKYSSSTTKLHNDKYIKYVENIVTSTLIFKKYIKDNVTSMLLSKKFDKNLMISVLIFMKYDSNLMISMLIFKKYIKKFNKYINI